MRRLIGLAVITLFGSAAVAQQIESVSFPPISTAIKMDGIADDWPTIVHMNKKFGGGEEHAQNIVKPHLNIDPVLIASDENYLYLFLRFPVARQEYSQHWTHGELVGEIRVDLNGDSMLIGDRDHEEFGEPAACELRIVFYSGEPLPVTIVGENGERRVQQLGISEVTFWIERLPGKEEYRYDMPWEGRDKLQAGELALEVGSSLVWEWGGKSTKPHLWLWTHHNLLAHGDDGIEAAIPLELIDAKGLDLITLYMKDEASVTVGGPRGVETHAYSQVLVDVRPALLTATDGPKRLEIPPPEIVQPGPAKNAN